MRFPYRPRLTYASPPFEALRLRSVLRAFCQGVFLSFEAEKRTFGAIEVDE